MKMVKLVKGMRLDKKAKIVDIDIEDVNYIRVLKTERVNYAVPVYHTAYGEFISPLALYELAEAYKDDGIVYSDGSTLIKEDRVINREPRAAGILITFVDGSTVEVSLKSRKR